jgi:hypothetical protein
MERPGFLLNCVSFRQGIERGYRSEKWPECQDEQLLELLSAATRENYNILEIKIVSYG